MLSHFCLKSLDNLINLFVCFILLLMGITVSIGDSGFFRNAIRTKRKVIINTHHLRIFIGGHAGTGQVVGVVVIEILKIKLKSYSSHFMSKTSLLLGR